MTTTIIVSGAKRISEYFLEELAGDIPLNKVESIIKSQGRYEVRLKNGDTYKILSSTPESFMGLQDVIIYAHIHTLTGEFISFLLSRRHEIRFFEL